MLSGPELEKLEKRYFDDICHRITHDRQRMIEGLKSKDKIRSDWWGKFVRVDKKRQTSDMAIGAERIFIWLISDKIGTPNSAPIGANLFFESHDAFIHIEIKTAREDNTSDYRGLVPINKNQTSYRATQSHRGTPINTLPGIPKYYSDGKPCLSYSIQIIYNHRTFEIIAILLISIPNGQLFSTYGNKIVNCGKTKDESFRYRYRSNPYFELVPEKPFRVRFIHFDQNSGFAKKDITANSLIQ